MSEPYYEDESVTLFHGDCIEVMRGLPDNSIDSVVTDPPYGLGFMGKAWDDLPPGEDWARECLRVLKPGGHLLAFGGSRTWHRLASAIEDAGFELRDSIAWIYGTGFPKSRAVLKPAFEPVVVARKSFRGSVAANMQTHGTGTLNIDGCRVQMSVSDRDAARVPMGRWAESGTTGATPTRSNSAFEPADGGRWPANVILDESQAELLDAQSGRSTSPSGYVRQGGTTSYDVGSGGQEREGMGVGYGDSGGASRFFYVPKAPKKERPEAGGVTHPTVKPLSLMRWLVRLATPPGGVALETFAGSGTTAEACILEEFRCIAIEREEAYLPLIMQRIDRCRKPLDGPTS